MTFLTIDDFKAVCDQQTLNVIDQADTANLDRAERYAIEEVSSYLRSRYDVAAVFNPQPADRSDNTPSPCTDPSADTHRNDYLVMIVADVCLYHLVAWLPKRIGFEIRETRYKQAIEWLKDVQAGKAMPDLPVPTDPDTGAPASQPVRYGGWRKSEYQY